MDIPDSIWHQIDQLVIMVCSDHPEDTIEVLGGYGEVDSISGLQTITFMLDSGELLSYSLYMEV